MLVWSTCECCQLVQIIAYDSRACTLRVTGSFLNIDWVSPMVYIHVVYIIMYWRHNADMILLAQLTRIHSNNIIICIYTTKCVMRYDVCMCVSPSITCPLITILLYTYVCTKCYCTYYTYYCYDASCYDMCTQEAVLLFPRTA